MGFICRCFYEKNIYLKDFGLHVIFVGDENEFRRRYGEFFSSYGCSEQEIEDIIVQVKREIKRRKELHDKAAERKSYILHYYKRLHPQLFMLKESYLEPQFITVVNYIKSPGATVDGLLSLPAVEKHAAPQVYIIPVFNQNFCKRLVEELEYFNASDFPKGRPNTMNNYGILLDELGFDENFLDPFISQFIQPLTKLLFPSCGGGSLDSYKAFTVKYKMGEDLNLGYHFDNAEVTLNVCIGKNFTEGNLYFGDMKQVPLDESECTEMTHSIGYGCLHRGQQMHGALPIHSGERHNIIVWMRSSQIRNKCCPMCDNSPDLVEVEGMGDGFSEQTVSVCSTS